jgi:hypothetical protein
VEGNITCRKRGNGDLSQHEQFTQVAASLRSAPVGPANGEGAKLRGQGPRAEADAARRLPACEARDAGGVTPSRWR